MTQQQNDDDSKISEFIWEINDDELNLWKNSNNGQTFESEPFTQCGAVWVIQIEHFPEEYYTSEHFGATLICKKMNKSKLNLTVDCHTEFVELKEKYDISYIFKKNDLSTSIHERFMNIYHMKEITKLTIKCKIQETIAMIWIIKHNTLENRWYDPYHKQTFQSKEFKQRGSIWSIEMDHRGNDHSPDYNPDHVDLESDTDSDSERMFGLTLKCKKMNQLANNNFIGVNYVIKFNELRENYRGEKIYIFADTFMANETNGQYHKDLFSLWDLQQHTESRSDSFHGSNLTIKCKIYAIMKIKNAKNNEFIWDVATKLLNSLKPTNRYDNAKILISPIFPTKNGIEWSILCMYHEIDNNDDIHSDDDSKDNIKFGGFSLSLKA
eukprot:525719_1